MYLQLVKRLHADGNLYICVLITGTAQLFLRTYVTAYNIAYSYNTR